MEFHVHAQSYNSYGGTPSLSRIGDFLLDERRDFGKAIKELSFEFNVTTSAPPRKTLEEMYTDFHDALARMPQVNFRRVTGKISIGIASTIFDGFNDESKPTIETFQRGLEEVLTSLDLLRGELKVSDDFDLEGFLQHCHAARDRSPRNAQELEALVERLNLESQERFAALSDWEKLDIDWVDFHPQAREILDSTFFWEPCDEFAPNGNDTGSDILDSYRRWLLEDPDQPRPLKFIRKEVRSWGYSGFDEMDSLEQDQFAIGLAFAEIKLRGECDPEIVRLALAAVERQRLDAVATADWAHMQERLDTLIPIEEKLRSLPT